jgi:hypothetical protein
MLVKIKDADSQSIATIYDKGIALVRKYAGNGNIRITLKIVGYILNIRPGTGCKKNNAFHTVIKRLVEGMFPNLNAKSKIMKGSNIGL